jgi:hypothetical protein
MQVTIGNGTAVHTAYTVKGNVTGSLCNPYAWERSRVRATDAAATCPRCAKATNRAAELVRAAERAATEAELHTPDCDLIVYRDGAHTCDCAVSA